MGKRGFTLIEIMVVLAIIIILATLGIANYQTSLQRGRDSKRMADLEKIRGALEMYHSDEETYPPDLHTLTTVPTNYLSALPTDPSGYTYYYNPISEHRYELLAFLEIDTGNDYGNFCGAPSSCNYRVTEP